MFESDRDCAGECVYCGDGCRKPSAGRGYLATRSTEVLRRIPVLRHRRTEVGIVIATLDHSLSARLEPGAPSPRQRLEMLSRLSAEGIAVGVEICPVLPGITDRLASLERITAVAARCGATWIRAHGLRLPPAARATFFRFLRRERSGLVRRYRARYGGTSEPPRLWAEGLEAMMADLRAQVGLLARPPRSGAAEQLSLPFAVAEGSMEYAGQRGIPEREPLLVAK